MALVPAVGASQYPLYGEVMSMFAVRLALDCGYGRMIGFGAFNAS